MSNYNLLHNDVLNSNDNYDNESANTQLPKVVSHQQY